MIVAEETKDIYESFDPGKDTFFFKVGSRGLISFHGRNCSITKRMSSEQLNRLTGNKAYIRINSSCYVNVDKISALDKDQIRFTEDVPGAKLIYVPIWKQPSLRQRLTERQQSIAQ